MLEVSPGTRVIEMGEVSMLPDEVDASGWGQFVQAHVAGGMGEWARRLEAVERPFLAKANCADAQDSLSLFKMVLRFVNGSEYDGRRDRLLADYICQRGLANVRLRDEILVQVVNQTWDDTG